MVCAKGFIFDERRYLCLRLAPDKYPIHMKNQHGDGISRYSFSLSMKNARFFKHILILLCEQICVLGDTYHRERI